MKKAFIGVYGCQMNIADAERMAGELAAIGYERTADIAAADLIIFNTCCVRETAESRIYGKIGEIKQLKRKNPQLIFGLAGCMAQKEGEALLKRAPHIDFILGTAKVSALAGIVHRLEETKGPVVAIDMPNEEKPPELMVKRDNNVSAWVPIMYGCNNFCTYCIVPYVRGRERSRQPDEILAEARAAIKDGCREITLLGQNVNSYNGGGAAFADLLLAVDGIDGVGRVRFMTSHPKDLSDELIAAVRAGRHICEHIHLPVQHGSDRILKAMNRAYTAEAYRELVRKIRAHIPQVSITTDFIVGFPGETEADFAELLDFVREMRYDAAYTFLYSPRSGTPAAELPHQVPDAVKHERLEKIMALQSEISLAHNEALRDAVVEVLVEGASKTSAAVWSGHTRTNKLVLWPHGEEQPGDFVQVRLTQPQTWVLKGILV